VRVDRLLGECAIAKDSAAGRRQLERALEARRGAEAGEELKRIRRGWCLGEETFRQELLALMGGRMGMEHYGEERAETAAANAERVIAEELRRRRWKAAELRARPKGDAGKVALAAPAGGDDDDGGVDCGTLGDGNPGLSEPSAVSPEKVRRGVAIIKN
jgi:hypothetical protein